MALSAGQWNSLGAFWVVSVFSKPWDSLITSSQDLPSQTGNPNFGRDYNAIHSKTEVVSEWKRVYFSWEATMIFLKSSSQTCFISNTPSAALTVLNGYLHDVRHTARAGLCIWKDNSELTRRAKQWKSRLGPLQSLYNYKLHSLF